MVNFATLISGSSGNSAFLSDGKTNILIDCGMSGTQLKNSLCSINVSADDIDALLITHEHIDHIKGAGVICRRHDIPIYTTEKTHMAMNIGKVSDENIRVIQKDSTFEIGTIGVRAFSISHDAVDPVGYNFFAENTKVSIATDIGDMTEVIEKNLYGSDIVLLESNHDIEMLKLGSYPYYLKQRILSENGHLSNDSAAKTALRLVQEGTKKIFLGHLSKENNTPEIAFKTVENLLVSAGVKLGFDMYLDIAKRSEVTIF